MKIILHITITSLALLSLQACSLDLVARTLFMSGQTVEMKNNEGNTVECSVSKATAVSNGADYRDQKIKECIREFEEQGYKRIGSND